MGLKTNKKKRTYGRMSVCEKEGFIERGEESE